MTDQRGDHYGRFRQPHTHEAVLDALAEKHAASAARLGLLHHKPSPFSPDTEQAAALERDLRRLTFH